MKDKKNTASKAEEVKAEQAAESAQAEEPAVETEQQKAAEITITREKLEELNAYVKAAEAKRDEYLAMAQRVQADFDNYRKRNASLRTEVADDTVRDTVKEVLPSLDNLERALTAAQAAGDDSPLAKGVEMTLRGFEEALKKLGMERVEAAPGTAFDPEKHNAVMMTEADEEHPEGTIIECFQTGFAVRGKVVRYAMVRVAN
ncbi:MAG: nucleotide exchange factor GrpE [Candidatus Spyradocola sp.]